MAIPVIAWIAINVGLYILNYAYRHFSRPDAVKPRAQQMRLPRVEENAVIPWFIGRVMVRSPLVVDKWGLSHEAVTMEVDGEDVVIGYRYVLGGVRFVLALGTPTGQTFLHRMWIGDREVMNVNGAPTRSGAESRLDFYGGKGQGGGVSFTWHLYPGTFDQSHADGSLVAVEESYDASGGDIDLFPPLRGQVAVALLNFNTGEGGQLEPMRAEIQYSDPESSSGGIHSLELIDGADANPAVALWYVLTDSWAGLGIDESDIDEDSFVAVGTTLAEEGNGFSMIDEEGGSAQSRIDTIIAQIDGVLYQEPTTGKWTLGLIRNDYDIGDLETYDPSNIVGLPEYDGGSWKNLTNQVFVVYEDRQKDYAERTARDQDLAGINREGGRLRTVTIPFPGCKNRLLASKLASRELRKLSLPLASVRIPVNRSGLNVRPGSVIKWTWPELGITEMVFRVVKVDPGTLTSNTITLHCVQDRFAYEYTGMEFPEFEPLPILPVFRIVERWTGEAPRWIQQRAYDLGSINDPDGARTLALAVPRNVMSRYMTTRVSVDAGASYANDTSGRKFPGRATVETAYGRENDPYDTTVGLRITDLAGCTLSSTADSAILLQGRNTAWLVDADGNEEIIGFGSVTDEGGGVYTLGEVWRGLMDTVPKDFAVGDRVYFLGSLNATTGEAQNLDTSRVGGTARDFEDALVISLATQGDYDHTDVVPFLDEHTVGLRALKPLPVADLELDGSKTPATLAEEGVDITWSRRDRLSEVIVRGNIADQEPEAGTTYVVEGWRGDRLVSNEILSSIDDVELLGAHLGILGYGAIEVAVRSRRTVTLPDGSAEALSSHQSPSIVIEAPEWRNLLLNPRGTDGLDGWTLSGTGEITAQTSGALGGAGYLFAAGVTDRNVSMRQIAVVSGYWPERLRATCVFYGKNLGADADDTLEVVLSARTSADVSIGTQTYGPTAQSTTQWLKRVLTYASLPATTHQLRVFATLYAEPGGDVNPQSAIAEYRLMVGQFTDDLIANGDFETGLTSWTSVAGTFTTPTTSPIYTGAQYAKGDAAADSEYRQDYAIGGSVGYEVGATAVLELARMNAHATLGTGTVTIECRDGSGVLASATTGAEHVGETWVRRRLTVEVPIGTTTIRVRLISTRTSATASACFDDVELRLHKHLEPDEDQTLDLATPDPRPLPVDRDHWNRQYPAIATPSLGLWAGSSLQGSLGTEPSMEASAATVYAGAKLVGFWDPELETMAADAVDLAGGRLRTGGNTSYANFRTADRFSVVIAARNAELGLAAARGLLGRLGTTGWSLSITAAGVAEARLVGSSSTKTATGTQVITGGAPFVIAMSYDGTNVRVIDGAGQVATATAGMGEIRCDEAVRFTIGRASTSETDFVGQVARVYLWRTAIPHTDLIEIVGDLGAALPGGLATFERSGFGYYLAGADSAGALVACAAEDRPAWGYASTADLAASSAPGMVFNGQSTNLFPTWDLTALTVSGATVAVCDVASPLGHVGQIDSIRITGTSAHYVGTNAIPLTADAGEKVISFYARATSAHNINVSVGSDASGEIDAFTVAITTTWARYDLVVAAWDVTTAAAFVQFYPSTDGTPRTFDLAAPIGFFDTNAEPGGTPAMIAAPGGGIVGPGFGTETTARTLQHQAEGEIIVAGCAMTQAPTCDLVDLSNGSNNDRRDLSIAAGAATFTHYNGTGTGTASETTAQAWDAPFVVRGRWARVGLIEVASAFAGVVFDGGTGTPADYDVASAFTVGATELDLLQIGAYENDPFNGVIRSIRVTARETRIEP